jgi:vancomycin resistance protein YoaR
MGKFDEIFDDVVVNAKAAASVVSKKASDVYDASKQKILAAEIRSDINKKLRDLGALTYKSQINSTDVADEVAKLVEEITELKENLSVITQNIATSKNQKKCPQCDATLPKNSVFCNICGAKIGDEEPETNSEEEPATTQDPENSTEE